MKQILQTIFNKNILFFFEVNVLKLNPCDPRTNIVNYKVHLFLLAARFIKKYSDNTKKCILAHTTPQPVETYAFT